MVLAGQGRERRQDCVLGAGRQADWLHGAPRYQPCTLSLLWPQCGKDRGRGPTKTLARQLPSGTLFCPSLLTASGCKREHRNCSSYAAPRGVAARHVPKRKRHGLRLVYRQRIDSTLCCSRIQEQTCTWVHVLSCPTASEAGRWPVGLQLRAAELPNDPQLPIISSRALTCLSTPPTAGAICSCLHEARYPSDRGYMHGGGLRLLEDVRLAQLGLGSLAISSQC